MRQPACRDPLYLSAVSDTVLERLLRPSFTHSLLLSEERRFPVYMYCQASALARGSQVFLSERISVCLSERDGQRGAARCAHGRLVL